MSIATRKIKKYLRDEERTYSWLARKLGTSRQSVQYWLDDHTLPSKVFREKLQKMFDLKDDWV